MVEILLAVYQGEHFLSAQIESIINQTYSDWKLLIRDDGSTDNSINIIESYIKSYPNKIVLIRDSVECHSSKANFMQLLKHASQDYVLFCDQDDIWDKNKIATMMEQMTLYEQSFGSNYPILLASQLKVVNSLLHPLHKQQMTIDSNRMHINKILVDNEIPGCTMMFNKALYSRIGNPDINKIVMHDWWIALFACTFGKISIIDQELVLYRQHDDNESGAANKRGFLYALKKINDPNNKSALFTLIEQASEFQNCYKEMETNSQRLLIDTFIDIGSKGKLSRVMLLVKYGFLKSGLFRVAGQLLFA